jgi:hypothetical protein
VLRIAASIAVAVLNKRDMKFSGLLLCFQLREGKKSQEYSESRNLPVLKDEISAATPRIYYQGTTPKPPKWHSD